MHTITM